MSWAAMSKTSSSAGGSISLSRRTSDNNSLPTATNSVLNQKAGTSLYQDCQFVLSTLDRVPGFQEAFTDQLVEELAPIAQDPVSRSLFLLRLGAPLCFLYNALALEGRDKLAIDPLTTSANVKACQKSSAYFIMAIAKLGWDDKDLFAVRDLYGQDTNGVVKVMRTAKKVLLLLDAEGKLEDRELPVPLDGEVPKAGRARIMFEILDSERKYVQDLEIMREYQEQLLQKNILPPDHVHDIFMNLSSLSDFQRRFLIGLEANCQQAPEDQRLGHMLLNMEDHFAVYEPFCTGLARAQALILQEKEALSQLSHIMEPLELQAFIIKPVQRICKYHLMLQDLLKATPADFPFRPELEEGFAASKRVADRSNEVVRQAQDDQDVLDLKAKVVDWKNYDVHRFGRPLLRGHFGVVKDGTENPYWVWLFEEMIVFFEEVGPAGAASPTLAKKASRRKLSASSSSSSVPMAKAGSLRLKGRIYMPTVVAAFPVLTKDRDLMLELRWRSDSGEGALSMKCPTEDLERKWQGAILTAMSESLDRRRSRPMSSKSSSSQLRSPFTPSSSSSPWFEPASPFFSPSQSGSSSPFVPASPQISARELELAMNNHHPSAPSSRSGSMSAAPDSRNRGLSRSKAESLAAASAFEGGRAAFGRTVSTESWATSIQSERSSASSFGNSPIDVPRSGWSSERSSLSHDATVTAATTPALSPVLPPGGSTGATPSMIIKILYNTDSSFSIAVPQSVDFEELRSKVQRKVKNTGSMSTVELSSLKLRYMDEDGDRILVNSEEDWQMALGDLSLEDGFVLYAS